MAQGDTARFSAMREQYQKDRETTAERLYIEAMEDVLDPEGGMITLIDSSLEGYLPVEMIGGSV